MEIASIKKELFLIIFLLASGGFGQTNIKMSREDTRIKIDNKGSLLLHEQFVIDTFLHFSLFSSISCRPKHLNTFSLFFNPPRN